MKGGQ